MELAAIFTATPAEIDTAIAEVSAQIDRQHQIKDHADHQINYRYATSADKAAGLQSADAAIAKIVVLGRLKLALEGEYSRRGGWQRVYAVNNSNGHFHRTQACSTTYATTPWVWMPGLSGLTNAEVVARTGKMSCLVCFASEREEIEEGREATVFTPAQQKSREERDEFARTSAKLAAEKAAKAITDLDGSPLRGDNGVIKTVRTAWIEAVDALTWAEYSEYMITTAPQHLEGEQLDRQIAWSRKQTKEHAETCGHIAQALANKTGRDLADVLTEINTKADKKIKAARKSRAAEEARLNG